MEDRERMINTLAMKYRNAIIREEEQVKREKKVRSNSDKGVILDNIRNFYKDRAEILKEHLQSQRNEAIDWEREEKKTESQARKDWKSSKTAKLQRLQYKLDRDKQLAALELQKIESQLISMYKRA